MEGGAKLLTDNGGSRGLAPGRDRGGRAPLQGLQGDSSLWPLAQGNFAFLNSIFAIQFILFCQHLISNESVIFFNYGNIGLYENGSFILLTLVPPRVPHRASNSPALRGSLPPGHYFSRSPAKHIKSPTSMKKNPAKYVKSPASVEKTYENNYLANFHRQGGMQPPKSYGILINLD